MAVELVLLGIALAVIAVIGGALVIKRMGQVEQLEEVAYDAIEEDQEEKEKLDGVAKDLTHLRWLIDSKKNTQVIYHACLEYEHLSKVEGFASVVTLFKHRHRKRALERLEIFCQEWDENGLKLYGRI